MKATLSLEMIFMNLRIFTLASLLLLCISSFAQLRIGFQTGMNLSNQFVKPESVYDHNFLPGFHFYGVGEVILNDHFSVEGRLGYTKKGYRYSYSDSYQDAGNNLVQSNLKGRVSVNYVDLPVLFKTAINTDKGRLFIGAGPYVGYATGGRYKEDSEVIFFNNTITTETNERIDWDNSNYNRLDYGLKGTIGYEQMGFSIEAGYDHGLQNLNSDPNSDTKWTNGVLSLSLGFRLGGY